MKVLVTGMTGLLGRALRDELADAEALDVIGTGLRRAAGDVVPLDLLDADAVERLLDAERPEAIVHAAAERRPDVSENDPDATRALNVEATRTVVRAARRINAWILFFSTDYVFDGTRPPYPPEATPHPLNFYGRTKLEGEEVTRSVPGNCILRVPLLYGGVESLEESPVTVIAKNVRESRTLRHDHWATRFPTFTGDVAHVCRQLLERRAEDPRLSGTFHWSGDEPFTKYEMARVVSEIWGLPVDDLIPDARAPSGAPRPQNSQLDCSDLERLGIGRRTPFREALAASLEPFR